MKRHKRIGLMLWTAPGLGAGFERGEWAEQAGYDDLWLPDAEGLQDPLTLGAALAMTTDKVRLCTGIVPVFTRPPAVLATSVVAVEQRAPARFVLGLGASTDNMVERWYGLEYAKPLTRVRETVVLIRAILAGKKTDFSGLTLRSRGFQLKECPQTPVPIYLGAIGPKMLQLAGELADGVILNDFTPPDRLDWALQQIDDGARRVGRRVDDLEIVKRRALYVHEDSEAGLDYFREHLAFYASAPAYQQIIIRLGYASAIDEIRAGYATRDRARISAAVSDEMVARIFNFGSAEHCRGLLRNDYQTGIDTVVVSPQGGTPALFTAGAEAFASDAFQLPD
jgi:probable F420-dependent oxidoreductase